VFEIRQIVTVHALTASVPMPGHTQAYTVVAAPWGMVLLAIKLPRTLLNRLALKRRRNTMEYNGIVVNMRKGYSEK